VERLPQGAPVDGASTALVPRSVAAPAVRETGTTGLWRTCARAVTRLVHLTVDGVRSLVALLGAAPASR
jgi:hypothetical protein